MSDRATGAALILLAIAMCALAVYSCSSVSSGYEPVPTSKWDEHIGLLDRKALDEAYAGQLSHLFSVWMKDDRGQPERAIAGARQARRAYIAVMTEIEKREEKK